MFPNQSYQALHLPRHFKVHPFIPFIIAIPHYYLREWPMATRELNKGI